MTNEATGRLYVVATPIGNLGDLSPRACEILKSCALIAAEDTRHTGVLLKHFGIETVQMSLHDHNEQQRTPDIISRLRQGAAIALVSEAASRALASIRASCWPSASAGRRSTSITSAHVRPSSPLTATPRHRS